MLPRPSTVVWLKRTLHSRPSSAWIYGVFGHRRRRRDVAISQTGPSHPTAPQTTCPLTARNRPASPRNSSRQPPNQRRPDQLGTGAIRAIVR